MTPTGLQHYETRFKKTHLPRDLVERLAPALVGHGSPPIGEEEVYALAGLQESKPVNGATLGLGVSVPDIFESIAAVDNASIRALREFAVTLPDCPARLKDLENEARRLRGLLRNRLMAQLEDHDDAYSA